MKNFSTVSLDSTDSIKEYNEKAAQNRLQKSDRLSSKNSSSCVSPTNEKSSRN